MQAVPYSTEELALFRPSEMTLAVDTKAGQKSVRELPAGSAALVAEAQREFSARQYDQAEQKYLQVLQHDEKNTYTLANLATIQLQLNHLDDAEKHINQALTQSPNDAYSLLVLGEIDIRRDKYDAALDALSHAAKLDPQNSEIQNYLGLTLSQKGLRAAAETAFRKAIQIDPGYASAHHNLAVFYITQKPPWTELARWHYKKALAAGFPPNPDLEKMLDLNKPAEVAQ
jgi:tetratricopeptide (TPR) repeat protein